MAGKKKNIFVNIRDHLQEHPHEREVVLYLMVTFLAFVCDLITRAVMDLLLQGFNNVVTIWIFPPQAFGSLIAFLTANIVAKVVSFILNRKATFRANNNRAFSIISYAVMSVVFIVIETIVGAPLQNALYSTFCGGYTGTALTTASALHPAVYQICGSASQVIYGTCDFIAAFFLDKFIIMRHK